MYGEVVALPDVEAFLLMLQQLGDEDRRGVDRRVRRRLAPVRWMMLAPLLSPVWVLERMLTVVASATGRTRRTIAPTGLLEAMQAWAARRERCSQGRRFG